MTLVLDLGLGEQIALTSGILVDMMQTKAWHVLAQLDLFTWAPTFHSEKNILWIAAGPMTMEACKTNLDLASP